LLLDQSLELISSFGPQRTGPPFISFSAQLNSRRRAEIQMTETKISYFLHSRSCVVKKQEKSSITQGVIALGRDAFKQRRHFLALKVVRLWRMYPFGGDQSHLFTGPEHFGRPLGNILKEGPKSRQPLIPCLNLILAIFLEVS